jgi:ADP-ribose pyrophosphatase YjhB (NUDIX family)
MGASALDCDLCCARRQDGWREEDGCPCATSSPYCKAAAAPPAPELGGPGTARGFAQSTSDAAVRETAEESGITVEVSGLAGIYTDPGHVIAGPHAGLVRQPFAVRFHCAAARCRAGQARGRS